MPSASDEVCDIPIIQYKVVEYHQRGVVLVPKYLC